MSQQFSIDSVEYLVNDLSEEGRSLIKRLKFVQFKLNELSNQKALMTRAKNAYIEDLKMEIVQGRSGLDLGTLFADD